jgi:hypothetical protein
MKATLFDLLGISRSLGDRLTPAVAVWPADLASLTRGWLVPSSDARAAIIAKLDAGATFSNIRPGVDARTKLGSGAPGQMSLAADMAVEGPAATDQPFYLRALPDHGIQLLNTDPQHPVRVYAAVDGRGFEVIIDRLPVVIQLKPGLASALTAAPVSAGVFDQTAVDGFAYTLTDGATPSTISCFVRLHLTIEGDIILEPTVPLSFGPVRWMGMPAKAVYDIQFLPSPSRTDYLEWTHNDPGSMFSNPPARGAIGFRSIDLDFSLPPLSDLSKRLKDGPVNMDHLEAVMEDVVLPATVPGLPIPSHGTFGFRRKITDPGDIAQAYSLENAPAKTTVYRSGSTTLTLEVEKFFFRTGDVKALDPADQPQVQLLAALIYQSGGDAQTPPGPKVGGAVSIDDQWMLAAALVLDPATTPVKFTIADTTIGLVGLKFGVSFTRLAKTMPFKDSFEIVADLFVQGKVPAESSGIFQITSLTGKQLSVVLRDIGWKLGNISMSGLSMPDGMQLIFANVVHVIIEELGWVEEPNGAPYFSFSGGVSIGKAGGDSQTPKGNASESSSGGFGIRVRRLRFLLNGDSSQPFMKIDGIFLKIAYGPVDVEGFGYISDFTAGEWAIKEWGFGVKVKLQLIAMEFDLSAMFLKGTQRKLADPSQEFSYFLAALELGYLPAGPIALYTIRALVADNMAPNLDSAFPDGEGMALLKWHQNHDSALKMPASRALADWMAEKGAFAIGVGCGFSINGVGKAAHIEIFVFFEKASANTGLLIVGELFLLKNPDPIAFIAIEYDIDKDKFGVMVGVDLTLSSFFSGGPVWLHELVRLSGTLYFGNQPWSFAIGQLADQTSWLTLAQDVDIPFFLTIKFHVGICVQIIDGGPKGFGVVVTLSAGSDWGVGGFLLWGSFGLIIGAWKTGSITSGVEFWIGLGFKINLFWVFSFGAEISLRISYLGEHPSFTTLHAEIRIDTPWFMPDVTFSIDKTWHEQLPFDTASTTQCLSEASAIDGTSQKSTPLLAAGLQGAMGDNKFLYTFNQLTGLSGIRIADPHLRGDIPVVSVDSTIAVNFLQPVANDSLVATTTYTGGVDAGAQTVQDLNLRYGLRAISVRRAPRFGPTAGVWSDLITESDTVFSIGGVAPQTLSFAWDVDQRADGKMDPKRLLINSSAPYSFATKGGKNDEEAARNDADFPCCDKRTERALIPKPHILQFTDLTMGSRAQRVERFSGMGGAWWHWTGLKTPAIAPGDPAYPGAHTARIFPGSSAFIGLADLPDPACLATLDLAWDALPGALIFEAYAGLKLAGSKSIDLRQAGETTATIGSPSQTASGFSRLTLRLEIDTLQLGGLHPELLLNAQMAVEAAIRILRITYVTLADALLYAGAKQRCVNGGALGPPGSDANGKLAFLPNHDYEIVLTTAVRLGGKEQGPRETLLSEAVYFRTKGLPGLNSAPHVGDDIRRHVASSYPLRRAIPLYRQEPCVLAFENSLSSVLPVDRTPPPGSPPEKAQMFPLELNVDRIVSLDGLKRLTVPSADWISSHRMNPYPVLVWEASTGYARSSVRLGRSADLLVQRYETVKIAFPNCGPPKLDHASQVLLHEPIGPDGSPGPWESQTGYRATVRQKSGPFTERVGFDVFDLGAFIPQGDGAAPAAMWSIDPKGAMLAPPPSAGRAYSSCGELDWDHLQAQSLIDLKTATAAGLAVGVGPGASVTQALLATVEKDGAGHALVLRSMSSGGETELGRKPLTVAGAVILHVTAFDDILRAAVGEVVLEAPRDAIRQGRVALVAHGRAHFAGLSIGALDIYSFEFITSRFASFAAHINSWDKKLSVSATGGFGGAPASVPAVLSAHAAAIPALMQAEADPQARQAAFTAVIAELGIGLSRAPLSLTLARMTDPSGTAGLIVQSPEPISLTRDVTLKLTQHVRIWIWDLQPVLSGPVIVQPRGSAQPPLTLNDIANLALAVHAAPDSASAIETMVMGLRFADARPFEPGDFPALPPGSQIARIISTPSGPAIELRSLSGAVETLTLNQAMRRPDLAAAARLSPGSVGVITPQGWHFGHWVEVDIDVEFTALANGDETVLLLLAKGGAVWPAGQYKLKATIIRDRWSNNGVADPEQTYNDEATLAFGW